LQFGLQQK